MTGAKDKQQQARKAGGFASVKSTMLRLLESKKVRENVKNLLRMNKDKGFDCPGCAWGDAPEGSIQFCENGAKAIAWESTSRTIGEAFFARHSVSYLNRQSDYWLEYQGRLTEPLRYNKNTDRYEPISWQAAFTLIADKLNALASPDEAEFYTSGRASNEVSFLYQLMGRTFGTNNFPDCSNMCHEASGVALNAAIGVGKGTVTLSDFEHADGIFVFGQNPGTNHPRMLNTLRKAAKRGCKIVSFNNLKEVGLQRFASPQVASELLTSAATAISHKYYTPKLGGDMAAVRGMAKHLLNTGAPFNQAFITRHTGNVEQYLAQLHATSWQHIEQQSGLTQAQLAEAAELFASCNNVISTWAMGITQHKHSVDTIREITNLHLLFGQIGRPGAGLCPVRGHSNVQGNRTMGINEKPNAGFITRLEQTFDRTFPTQSGHNVYHALKALHEKRSKVLICLGGNIAAAAADSVFTHQAVRNAELNVQISTKLNRSHLQVSEEALILPCLGRTELDSTSLGEQQITVEDTFSMVHASQGRTPPASEHLRSEVNIIANIAHATLGNHPVNWLELADDNSRIRALIEQSIEGFTGFNRNLKQPGGFYLGNAAASLEWKTRSGRAEFSAAPLPESIFPMAVSEKIEQHKHSVFTLQTLRSHDQYNTTIYGMEDRYRGVSGDRKILFINPKDAQRHKLNDGDKVNITSIWQDNVTRQVTGFKLVYYDIPKGNLAAYYPETNPLVPIDSIGDQSFTPTSKSIAVVIEKATFSADTIAVSAR
ncbi:CbbBc protein [Alteromonas aestuariivivens]|uniref:CbbBc protein n=1 Tax=Alteromonas aestuariivivens TaxID=1938339 RepID=A0A3D8M6U5_9ALTE|nr:FdhF/YdeP family oxidoreductase [Alteromonas aestuariivivens]RDV25248.1 CbbBc protein [Alteromonas aestuariivivens]